MLRLGLARLAAELVGPAIGVIAAAGDRQDTGCDGDRERHRECVVHALLLYDRVCFAHGHWSLVRW